MARDRFERSVTIRAAPTSIYAELADPERQIGLQPFLVRVTELPTPDLARTRSFRAVEVIRIFGVLPLPAPIRVRVDLVAPAKIIDFEARSLPGLSVRSRFTLSEVESGTYVHEAVTVEAPALVRTFVQRKAIRAQEALLANLARRLESRPSQP